MEDEEFRRKAYELVERELRALPDASITIVPGEHYQCAVILPSRTNYADTLEEAMRLAATPKPESEEP